MENNNYKQELENQYTILIKSSERMEQKRFIIIITITILTFLSVLISILFSFLAYKKTLNIDQEEPINITHYQTLTTTFNNKDTLTLTGIGNGYTLKNPKIIEITNEGDTEITFDIKLTSISTSLLSTNNLVYNLAYNNNESTDKELPLSEKVLVSDNKIAPNETITFILKVAFNGTIEENNYTNYYNAKIEIEQKDNKSNLLD